MKGKTEKKKVAIGPSNLLTQPATWMRKREKECGWRGPQVASARCLQTAIRQKQQLTG